MSAVQEIVLLLSDAVDRVKANPSCSRNWRTLLVQLAAIPDPELRSRAVNMVAPIARRCDMGGYLCATFLANCSTDPAHLSLAGELAGAVMPYDADRVATFCALQWGQAVNDASSHAALLDQLRTARLPELMLQAGARLAQNPGMPLPRPVAQARRIALIAPLISGFNHPPTEMALKQAFLMQQQGCSVHVFSAQETLLPNMEDYVGTDARINANRPDRTTLGGRIPPGAQITLADERFTSTRRWHDLLPRIAAFDPDVVLFVGLFSPLVNALYEVRPVVGLAIHATQPLACADVWLTADQARANRESAEWGVLPPAWGHYHPYRASAKLAPRTRPVDRDNELVLITVGARLGTEISGVWAERMLSFLARQPHARWLLAGGTGALPPALASAPPGQISCIPFASEIAAIYARSDIYVNPPRVGGGLSVAEAMAAGLPVLALVGGDGGSKLGPLAMADSDAYFAQLDRLASDEAMRTEAGALTRQRFRETLDVDASGPSLLAACDTAIARFRAREKVSPAPS